MKISLCLIVRNEEKTLGQCLESFSPLTQEIIVIDTGSSDKTKSIAKQFGAKIFNFHWIDDFSAARNFSLSKATQEWIMMVDADDILEKKTIKNLLQEMKTLKDNIDVICLPYIYSKIGKNTAYLPRIWKRELNLNWKYPIHEYLDQSKIPKNRIKKINLPIIHQKAKEDFKKGFERNVFILKKYLKKKPNDLRLLYYMVHDSEQIKDDESIIYWAQKYLESIPKDSIKLCRTLIRKGRAHLRREEWMLAQESFLLANGVNALLIEPYLALGDLYKKEKRYKEAIHMYKCAQMCEKPALSNVSYNQAMYSYSPLKKLAYTLPLIGKIEEAIEYTQKVLKYLPEDKNLLKHIQKLNLDLKKNLSQKQVRLYNLACGLIV